MISPDRALARRIELHEAWSAAEHARIQAQLYPETDAAVMELPGARAVFCGRKSPLSRVYAWGMLGSPVEADVDSIEAFFRSRQLDARIRVSPFADSSQLSLLGRRGYSVSAFMNVFVRGLHGLGDETPALPGTTIQLATAEDARIWYARDGANGDWAEPDGLTFMMIRSVLKADTSLFLAWFEGQPISGGALEIHDGVAALMAASTLPAFRRRGLHTALLHARLAAAAAAGCDFALMHAEAGAASQRNALRAGFQLAYTAAILSSPEQRPNTR